MPSVHNRKFPHINTQTAHSRYVNLKPDKSQHRKIAIESMSSCEGIGNLFLLGKGETFSLSMHCLADRPHSRQDHTSKKIWLKQIFTWYDFKSEHNLGWVENGVDL